MSSARYGSLILTGLLIFGVISWFKTDVAILGWDSASHDTFRADLVREENSGPGVFPALTRAFTRPRISIKWPILSAVLGLAIFLPFFLDSVRTDFAWFDGLSNLSGARRGPDAMKGISFQTHRLLGT